MAMFIKFLNEQINTKMSDPSFNPEIEEEVLEETQNNQAVVVTLPLDVYNEQADSIRALQADVTFIKEQIQILVQQGLPPGTSSTSTQDFFNPIREFMPLGSTDALIRFEELLGKNDNKKKFEKFLASFVLFKKPLKEITVAFIEKVYDLALQSQVSYSGAGGKQALKSLCSTQVLIKALVDHSLFDNTENPAAQACVEFRYQMQHACDRIRSSKRKQSGSVSRQRVSRQKLTVPLLKMELNDGHNEDEVLDEDTE
ncbi:uncharacterized protein LOC135708918 [Ochlerotatus camptorhynchus]|uniref:uncharacterized protein LOC135708918 n=1 Tax=Ochlerotatus camptorhynchus TaxID=644619 RepID=UPI0031DCBFEF